MQKGLAPQRAQEELEQWCSEGIAREGACFRESQASKCLERSALLQRSREHKRSTFEAAILAMTGCGESWPRAIVQKVANFGQRRVLATAFPITSGQEYVAETSGRRARSRTLRVRLRKLAIQIRKD